MIQRIQTLFWLIATILLAVLLGTDYATITHAGIDTNLGVLLTLQLLPTLGLPFWLEIVAVPIPFLAILCTALNAISIFLYRKAKWQVSLSLWAITLQMVLTLLMWLVPQAAEKTCDVLYTVRLPFFLPLLATAFTYLALRGVLRDRNFLRRMDRLR